ncbi:MAG TPA: glycoside hydrolase family 3 protein [Campylobacterales bacterium]|nr:glycoside hydrolase family 3 protein [Campylobacterales bacterium]
MLRIVLLFLTLNFYLVASDLESKISNMIVIGFDGYDVNKSSDLFEHPLGGVILFDKNIQNPKQLEKLIFKLKRFSKNRLLVTVDEEGGLVSRVGKVEGFVKTPSAKDIALKSKEDAKKDYKNMASMLHGLGVNCNLAPSVDLSVNPQNRVIVKNKRSYSKEPEVVVEYASIFIKEMQKNGVLSVVKHFPGHGSSLGDSHDGFVDVSDTWTKKELIPFETLIKNGMAKMVMTAHIYNKNIDTKYPATLSYKTNHDMLREHLGFKGVLISDDLQMGAISKNYTLQETLKLAINSGVDLLLFANQISKPVKIEKIISCVVKLVESGKIDIKTIEKANKRIEILKRGLL